MNVKPYLPMLSSDEKEVIMEQYYASKKKLNKGTNGVGSLIPNKNVGPPDRIQQLPPSAVNTTN